MPFRVKGRAGAGIPGFKYSPARLRSGVFNGCLDMSFRRIAACWLVLFCVLAAPAGAGAARHNVVLFVADGLRADSVTPESAPTLTKLRHDGVDFTNSHSIYPTVTTVNASAIATGHYPGDNGNFGNQFLVGFAVPQEGGARIAGVEDDAVLGELNDHYGGNYLNEQSLLAAARAMGFATASIGKMGPTAIQDVTARDGSTFVVDLGTGTDKGIAIAPAFAAAMKAAGLPDISPKYAMPNSAFQNYMNDVATKVALPALKDSGKPFVLVFWSPDPDLSQHVTKDSPGKLMPGINGPAGKAGIRTADDALAAILNSLTALGLDKTTDVFVTADHGFSTLDKSSKTSTAARIEFDRVPKGELPSGFLAIDLADGLGLPLFNPSTQKAVDYRAGHRGASGNGYIGTDPKDPYAVVVANGGTDFVYLPGERPTDRAWQVVHLLMMQDYVSGIFVRDALGSIPGTLPTSAINLKGTARTIEPDIVVNFRSHLIKNCEPVLMCGASVGDTSLVTGQGMHGTFSRADTRNFMAAAGPSFKSGFADPAPVSNADITPTLAHLMGIEIKPVGGLKGRVIAEAFRRGKVPTVTHGWQVSAPGPDGLKTVLDYQQVGGTRYFDAAGFPDRTLGLTLPGNPPKH